MVTGKKGVSAVMSFQTVFILFFLVMNPLGNLPLYIAELSDFPGERYRPIVLRESLTALAVLLLFLFCGGTILNYLHLTQASLELSGGVILFLIALKLIFVPSAPGANPQNRPKTEPFIVPLAIPLFAGPATMSTAIIVGGKGNWEHLLLSGGAMFCAWLLSTLILLSGRYAVRYLGQKALTALESLMGLLLTAISLQMIVAGIKLAFHLT